MMKPALLALFFVLVGCSGGDGGQPSSSSAAGGGGGGGAQSASSSMTASGSTGTGSGGEAEWTLVPWWTGTCVFEYAQKPENAFPPLEWEACPGNAPGCERVVKNWPHEIPTGIAAPAVQQRGTGHTLALLVAYPGLEQRTAIVDSNGKTIFAYRIPPSADCNAIQPALSASGHWAGAQQVGASAVSNYVFQPIDQTPAAALLASTTKVSQEQRGGDELFSTQLDFGQGVEIFDRVSQAVYASPGNLVGADIPRLVDDAAFFLAYPEYNKPEVWIWTRGSGAFAELIDKNPNHVVDVQADENHVVWIETPPKQDAGPWPSGTLYSAPYATTGALRGSARRAMPSVEPGASSAMGGGYYAVWTSPATFHVVRVRDAQMWTVDIPMDEWRAKLDDVSYIDATYVFYKTDTHVYRQRLDALGPGEPAN